MGERQSGQTFTINHPAPPSNAGDLVRYVRAQRVALDEFARTISEELSAKRAAGAVAVAEFVNGRFRQDGDNVWFELKDPETGKFYVPFMKGNRLTNSESGRE